jgi:hypothetical protein
MHLSAAGRIEPVVHRAPVMAALVVSRPLQLSERLPWHDVRGKEN